MTVGELREILERESSDARVVSYCGEYGRADEVCVSREDDGAICISGFKAWPESSIISSDI